MKPTVLVTDAEQRASLAVVRSLGRAGYTVFTCAARPAALAASSRFCRGHAVVPEALTEPDRFVEALVQLVRRHSADVLLPIVDASVLAVLSRRDDLPVRVPFPALETYRQASDKQGVIEEAVRAGFDVPRQFVIASPGCDLPARVLVFPVVIKPHRSVAGGMKHPVRYAEDQEGLEAVLAGLPPAAFPVLIQERIIGPGLGMFFLVWEGKVVARFAHRRLLEKPPAGGVSVRCESVAPDERLLAKAERLLHGLAWQGVAMVECKQDRASGRQYIMEVNGRFWGSLQLAVDAGVDFPLLLVSLALGGSVEPVLSWRSGVRMRWSFGEIDHVVARLRKPGSSLALSPDLPRLGAVLGNWLLAPFQGVRGEVLRWNDPVPALREAMEWVRRR